MAAYNNILRIIKEMRHGDRTVGKAGQLPDLAFKDLRGRTPEYIDPELLMFQHGVNSRGWSEEKTAEFIAAVLNSEKTRAIPGFRGKGRVAGEALIKSDEPMPFVIPVMPTRDGQAGMVTMFDESPEKIIWHLEREKRLMGLPEGRGFPHTRSTIVSPQIGGDAVSQLSLSAVDDPSAIDAILKQLKGGVKVVAPFVATGGLLGAVNTLHSWDGRDKLHPSEMRRNISAVILLAAVPNFCCQKPFGVPLRTIRVPAAGMAAKNRDCPAFPNLC